MVTTISKMRQLSGVLFVALLLGSVHVARTDAVQCATYFEWEGGSFYDYEACVFFGIDEEQACDEMLTQCNSDCIGASYLGGEQAACAPYESEGQVVISSYWCYCVG